MPGKIIKHHRFVDDAYELVTGQTSDEVSIHGTCIVPLSMWNQRALEEGKGTHPAGLWLDSDEAPEDIVGNLSQATIIAIHFPTFTDGRGYSIARLLRQRFQYTGELRAIGDIRRDQLYYLSRCGFDSFALADASQDESVLEALNDFSAAYQNAADRRIPVVR